MGRPKRVFVRGRETKKEKQKVNYILKEWCRRGIENRHHILPDARGGKDSGNTIRTDISLHDAWHFLFGLMTFSEVAEKLEEIERLVRQNPKILYSFDHFFKDKRSKRFLDGRL